ncbi:VCBS repeat-containing protein [Marinilongibacter aquaticus]|uniref:VCBS repeat-containing protein n=1 Tax=Marinilongibacter aquaticus TaxID=2975157 RepID=UPI0021BD7367|nr:VCBS repeat-containing protein [Marinilongibacter aquaticus]UBM60839.1 VCBS repeat-containing protein [Marinilongibacter aquaticus]
MKNLLSVFALAFLALACEKENKALFSEIPVEHSQIYFENRIVENEQYNVFDFHNLYNGGGVALVDVNQDDLLDIYLTGNQVTDKLYLNRGNFEFEDISEAAGIVSSDWSTGVAIADVNGDGLPDIYVCKSGNEEGKKHQDKLYINDGDLHFREEAQARGIVDTCYSTHAAFVDFDKDGDMDLYVLTTSNIIRNPNLLHKKDHYGDYALDKLYINDGKGHFTEEGKKRGIDQNTHGLGLAVGDINGDGWEDFFASSDFLPNDVVYINNQDGTFSEMAKELLPYQSRFSMGNDLGDLDNDGLLDIITVDMLPPDNLRQKRMLMTSYHVFETEQTLDYQAEFARNMLFKNLGTDQNGLSHFTEIGQLTGLAATDWSWAPLFVDLDNDGLKDVYVSNGYLRDVTNSDFVANNLNFSQSAISKSDMRNFMNQSALRLPKLESKNQFFRQTAPLAFEEKTESWIAEKPNFSNGAIFGDLDNDGDLDYVCSNINAKISLYRNESRNRHLSIKLEGKQGNIFGQGARISVEIEGQKQTYIQNLSRGYRSSFSPEIIVGCGKAEKIDRVEIVWPSGMSEIRENIPTNEKIVLKESEATKPAKPEYKTLALFEEIPSAVSHKETEFIDYYRENLLLHKYSKPGPAVAKADLDGDGFDDLFVGGNTNLQQKIYTSEATEVWSQPSLGEDADALFFDANKDGMPDLYVVSGSNEFDHYQDQLLINKGQYRFEKAVLPSMDIPGKCAVSFDFDQDGDQDILRIGAVLPGAFPKVAQSFLLINENGQFKAQAFGNLGLATAVQSVDLNKDQWPDIVVVGEFMAPQIWLNQKGQFEKMDALDTLKGLWNTVEAADLDQDGYTDLILGNIGKNYRYTFDEQHPLSINETENGKGFLPSYFLQGVEYPLSNRDELIRQFPFLRAKFPDYESYAQANMESLRNDFPLSKLKANKMQSLILWNKEGKGFDVQLLPEEVQQSPVQAILAIDYNKDQKIDLLLAGNDLSIEPINAGFVEGSKGVLLENLGNRAFKSITNTESGIWLDGQTKALRKMSTKKGDQILAARNDLYFKFYRLKSNP